VAASLTESPLKLRATDEEDLSVIAACLQDALVPIGDMTFLPDDRRFVFVANRFRWEADRPDAAVGAAEDTMDASYEGPSEAPFERTNCGVWFEGVTSVRTKGVDLRNRGRILELLTLRRDDGRLMLLFAGGATIRLEFDRLQCFLEDIGEPWPTSRRPDHPVTTGEGSGQ
jgi:hypothetical protein